MFVDTYKAVIIRNLAPKRPNSQAHNSNYESPIRRHFVSRKIQTSAQKRPSRNHNGSKNYEMSNSQERRKVYKAEYEPRPLSKH